MQRKPVESSFISAVGYDPKSGVCEVEFARGDVHRYPMGPDEYAAFIGAPSVGKHFHAHIKKLPTIAVNAG